MVGTRRNAPKSGVSHRAGAALRSSSVSKPKSRGKTREGLPDVYRDMLAEAAASQSQEASGTVEPPLKRPKRPGQRIPPAKAPVVIHTAPNDLEEETSDEDVEFEDVDLPAPVIQTTERDSEDEDDEDVVFEDIQLKMESLEAVPGSDKPLDLELNLTAQASVTSRKSVDRRKALTKTERERRIEIHKLHLLCLLTHVARRNHWCNDVQVQESLRPLLTNKMITYLNPGTNLSQFGRTESLKTGIQQVSSVFKAKFDITERGMRRTLWAEDEEHLKTYQMPSDLESIMDKSDFREAANTLRGSRDVGAQLFCALLRTAGVEARLVSSLQPLSFAAGMPVLPKPKNQKTPTKATRPHIPSIYKPPEEASTSASTPSPRRRLGHPNAAAYNMPSINAPTSTSSRQQPTPKTIRNESPFPIYWVEVLDVAHQKWQPVDPLVTSTQWKPAKLEPPASDRENSLCYAIAFDDDGSAKDVTRRYAKAYNSKTRRLRVDGLPEHNLVVGHQDDQRALSAAKWLRRVMKVYRRPFPTDVDQIEDNELTAAEAKEGMPRNVADFKDHPVYALERHLRRHEVLLPDSTAVGTVAAGPKGSLCKIYRRKDVRIARSAERWYRLGREVRGSAAPVRWLPKAARRRGFLEEEDDDDDPVLGGTGGEAGTPIFTFEQTEAYVPPPIVRGKVPKNKFGNLDVYVQSMVPAGGVHIVDEKAAHAAFVLGVDYAPALTGFKFKGRHGTAVISGVVIPKENEEAVRVVIDALGDLEAEMEAERRTKAALRGWSRFLKALRIRDRIITAAEERGEDVEEVDKGKGVADEEDMDLDMAIDDAESDITEEYDLMEDDEGGGGFLIE